MNNEKTVKGLWAVVKTQNGKHCIPVKIESNKLDKVTFYGWAFGERLHEYPRSAIMITCETEKAANDYIKSICDENRFIKESVSDVNHICDTLNSEGISFEDVESNGDSVVITLDHDNCDDDAIEKTIQILKSRLGVNAMPGEYDDQVIINNKLTESNGSGAEDYSASSIESLNDYASGLGDACKDLKPGDGIIVKGYYVERSDDGQTYYVWVDLYESINEDTEPRKRISYRGYIIRPRKSDDGELYYDIIKPKWSTTEPIWDWCDSVEEAKQWIDSDKDEPFEESKSVNESNSITSEFNNLIAPIKNKYSEVDFIVNAHTKLGCEVVADNNKDRDAVEDEIIDVTDGTKFKYIQSADKMNKARGHRAYVNMIFDFDDTSLNESKSIKEGYELLGGSKVEVYSDYDIAKKRAKELGLKEAEYGDSGKFSYCYWNETGDRNDEEQVIAYYTFENGKPRPLTPEERDIVAREYVIDYFDNDESKSLTERSDVELTEDEKDDILFTVAMGFETGHQVAEDFEEFKDSFENISNAKAGWEYYCELVNLGPAGFYAEHKDDYIFDDMFIAEYGGESEEDEGPYLGKGKVRVTAYSHYGPGELPYLTNKFDAKEWPEILKHFADTSHGSRPFEVLSVDGSEVSGWYVYNNKTGEYVFTTSNPQELLDKFNSITESDGRKATHTSTVYLVDYENGLSLPFDDRDTAIDYAIDSDAKQVVKATMYHFSDDESDTDIDGDNSEVIWTDYPNPTTENLKESSKTDKFNVIDTIGDSADDTREYTQAQMYDFCKELIEIEEESSEPERYANRPKLDYDLKSITAVLKHFGYEVKPITSVKEDLSDCDEDTSILEKMTNEGYDPIDVYSIYEIKNADTDEVIRKIHTTSMDPDDSSTWFDDDDIISQYAGDGIIITRYDYDQGMLDKSTVIYPEEDEDAINAIYDGNANGICTEDINENETENVQKWAIFADDRFQMHVNGTEDMAKEAIADMQKADEEDKALFIANGLDMPVYRYELVKYVQSEDPEISNMFKVDENFKIRQSNGIIG